MRGFVWNLELMPHLPRLTKTHERTIRVARSELDSSSRLCSHSAQHRAVVRVRDLFELSACITRALKIVDRKQDLDAGGQETRARQPLCRPS